LYDKNYIPITINLNVQFKSKFNIKLFGEVTISDKVVSLFVKKQIETIKTCFKMFKTKRKLLNTNCPSIIDDKMFNIIQSIIAKKEDTSYYGILQVDTLSFDTDSSLKISNNLHIYKNKIFTITYNVTSDRYEEYSRYYDEFMWYIDVSINEIDIELYNGFCIIDQNKINLLDELKYLDIESKKELWDLKQKYDGKITKSFSLYPNFIYFIFNFDLKQ
jgi:hypothetical protein